MYKAEPMLRLGSYEETKESIFGVINSEEECLKIIDMCRMGALPRVKSRLSDAERNSIRPGSIYVYEEEESKISRWTDSKVWSSSKIYGRCLIYYELDTPHDDTIETLKYNGNLDSIISMGREIISLGSHDKRKKKKNGLIKLSTSLRYQEKTYHLLSYYTETFAIKYVRGSIWNLVNTWEIPKNLVLRMNYRRKRKAIRPHSSDPIKPIKIQIEDDANKCSSFPMHERAYAPEDYNSLNVTTETSADFLKECYLKENNYFSF